MKRHERTDFEKFQVGQRVKGKAGTTWAGETGTVIFFYAGNLEITHDATGEDVAVPAEDFTIVDDQTDFVRQVVADLTIKKKHNKVSIEKLAGEFGITDRTMIKELTELAIVTRARQIAHNGQPLRTRYDLIVELYESQVNLSHRTSQSILLQQYSTPAPIGFLAGIFCGIDEFVKYEQRGLEPSAGNGLLTIAAKPETMYVNEVDEIRFNNLKKQGFNETSRFDATLMPRQFENYFNAVITNPPFGRLDKPISFDGFIIKNLEHLMGIRALECMNEHGRAALIVGGHRRFDEKGRIRAGKDRVFYNYLYNHYNVMDVIMIDGSKLYSRQGTSVDTELILIDGRKRPASGAAPLFDKNRDVKVKSFDVLYDRVMWAKSKAKPLNLGDEAYLTSVRASVARLKSLLNEDDDLGAIYRPASQSPVKLDTQVPDSMDFEIHSALQSIAEEVGGDIDNFVRHRLGYKTKERLFKALSAEQIDAVALAIYNIEARGQAMIIGDQTGIGKGRVAAAMIRYGVEQGMKPIFLTEKANLFSDIYRDLAAIGSGHLEPFIVNSKDTKTDIKDEDGQVIYQALPTASQEEIFSQRKLPDRFSFVVATYTQFNSFEKKPTKPNFLKAIAENNIMVMDESHNSSGSSNTGQFLQGVVASTKGMVYLSATFAKRPDNMPIYAMKTAMQEANMSRGQFVEAMVHGGVALQEIISSQLVAEGQMTRRERSYEGIEVNYITLNELKQEHQSIADNITAILREIISFQENYIDKMVEQMDEMIAEEGREATIRAGTSKAGVDNLPYYSKIFNVINQMLFSIKAEAVADHAIQRLREGKKPVIAFASTMGSFIEQMDRYDGMEISEGHAINADFSEVLQRGLDGLMRYTIKDIDGNPDFMDFSVRELSPEGQAAYHNLSEKIQSVSTGISISPIDVVKQRIEAAGFRVAEVTGRKLRLELNGAGQGLVLPRKKINTNDAFRQFNNNEVDVLMINQSGSTGASAHAIPTAKVPKENVKQRVMIILQPELDINTEVQKRGRVNRTGQVLKPIYDYMVSAIPAEKRLMMMLQRKLKSLDANTASNQKQSTSILDVPDFLNKYGDKVVTDYLNENPEVNKMLGDPLDLAKNKDRVNDEASHKVSGRVAVLPVKQQQEFYDEITERYSDYIEYLKQVDEYDLEVETMNLQTETVHSEVVVMGKGGQSAFGEDTVLEKVKANVLKKPFSALELDNLITEGLKGRIAHDVASDLIFDYNAFKAGKIAEEGQKIDMKYNLAIKSIPSEKKIQRIKALNDETMLRTAIRLREDELEQEREEQIELLNEQYSNRSAYLSRIFKYFYPGRLLNYPVQSFDTGEQMVPAVCIGILIDARKKNPYAPNAIKVRLAIASGMKYLAIPASYSESLNAIMGVSNDVQQLGKEDLLIEWNAMVKKRAIDRTTRYIITGNLLQAFSEFRGKLVSYTTMQGETKKGILMPEYWVLEEREQQGLVVPIHNAAKIVASLVIGKSIETNNGITFVHQPGQFKVIVSGSRDHGGLYYLDEELLPLVEKKVFEKVSDKMVAILPDKNLDAFLDVLQRKHNVSVTVTREQERLVQKSKAFRATNPIVLPPPPSKEDDQQDEEGTDLLPVEIIRIKAKALALKLKLAA